ncbi:MAG: peptidoglycan-binding protein [Oscillospiraceae bacterium]|nr:peptidoglycan-binding protein [Oscillospiraceae bacterium]
MSPSYGIDVSSYQGAIDWEKVKGTGCRHAVLKITRKDLTADRQFERNLRGCRQQGIPYHVYRYVYEKTAEEARTAAGAVVRLLNGQNAQQTVRVWWDVEDKTICPSSDDERHQLADSILAAQQVVEEAGYSFGVYCGWYWYKSVLDHSRLTCPFWIARYPNVKQLDFGAIPAKQYRPVTTQSLWGWQYSSRGRIDGISGAVDLNELYELEGSAAQTDITPVTRFQLWLWQQGENALAADGVFGPKSRKAAVRVLQRLLNCRYQAGLTVDGVFGGKTKAALPTLKKGDKGELVYLLQGLLYAAGEEPEGFDGSFGPGCQKAVRAFQKGAGLTVDGLAGKNTFDKLVRESGI